MSIFFKTVGKVKWKNLQEYEIACQTANRKLVEVQKKFPSAKTVDGKFVILIQVPRFGEPTITLKSILSKNDKKN